MGLGLALHQATRSEMQPVILLELIHFLESIANDILRRYEQNGYIYIPTGIDLSPYTPGRITLSTFDNIDVSEETIDEKNTFHATQCVLWQHGPPSLPE